MVINVTLSCLSLELFSVPLGTNNEDVIESRGLFGLWSVSKPPKLCNKLWNRSVFLCEWRRRMA